MAELTEGKRAPAFSLPASTGDKIALKDFNDNSTVVLYFYPRDNTPGCTKEACSFRDLSSELEEIGAVILGVSTDDLKSHDKFAAKHELNFPLLSDTDAAIATKYGVWQEKKMYGKSRMGIVRTTFVIDKAGKIRKIWPKVKVDQHADEVLEFVKSLD